MYIGQITTKKGVHKRKFAYSKKAGSAYHWTYVKRAINTKKRKLIAEGMEQAIAKKKYIKYDNGDKSTKMFDDLKPLKFNISKLAKKTYVNCCNLASICCRYAGISTPRKSSSLTLHNKWSDKDFKRLPYKEGMKLSKGDVLISTTTPKPHTAVVL